MRPRADFECKPCGVKAGSGPIVHENLPVSSMFCPYTGKRRGFKRLFNKVQVSTRGHRAARFIDRRLQPQMDEHAAKTSSAKQFEMERAAAMDKTYELAAPEQRQQIAQAGAMNPIQPAKAAFSSIDPAARRDSHAYTWPMVNRSVVPSWETAKR